MVNPFKNLKFESMSYLPQLTDAEIAKQVEYMVKQGWAPCVEFDSAANGFVTRKSGYNGPCYYDNRYWVMYKLPMFGCTDPSQVLTEIANAKRCGQGIKGFALPFILSPTSARPARG